MHFQCHPVPKGKRIERVGWNDGYLLVWFRGSTAAYVYGPGVAEDERDKILRVPYPDRQLESVKKKYPCKKIEADPQPKTRQQGRIRFGG